MGFGDLECYGHPYAKTPNICRLAEEGTQFLRHYTPGKNCNPARTGFMTSRTPPSFPSYAADFGFQGAATITELLQAKGYATAHFGKVRYNIHIICYICSFTLLCSHTITFCGIF